MFICGLCQIVSQPGEKATTVVLEERARSKGQEIVRETKAHALCALQRMHAQELEASDG